MSTTAHATPPASGRFGGGGADSGGGGADAGGGGGGGHSVKVRPSTYTRLIEIRNRHRLGGIAQVIDLLADAWETLPEGTRQKIIQRDAA